jgi:hypothetical protein
MTRSAECGQTSPMMIESKRSTILLLLSIAACTLDPAELDGDDELGDGESDDVDSTDTGDTTDETDGTDTGVEELVECLAGSNLDGSTAAPVEFQFLGDVVDCAEGWGHDAPLFASEWSNLELTTGHPWWLLPRGDGVEVVMRNVFAEPEFAVWFIAVDGSGEMGEPRLAPQELAGLTSVAVGPGGRLIFTSEDLDEPGHHEIGMLNPTWETIEWSVPVEILSLGPIAPIPGGFLLAGSDDVVNNTRVFRVSDQGDMLDDMPTDVPFGDLLITSGEGFVLAGASTVARFEAEGALDWEWTDEEQELQLTDVAADGLDVIAIGNREHQPWVARIVEGEIDWSSQYRRAETWHPVGMPEQPRELYDFLYALAPLGDGTFVAGGSESVLHPVDPSIHQAWLVRFDGDGNTISRDRMFVADGFVVDGAMSNGAFYGMARIDPGHVIRKYPL